MHKTVNSSPESGVGPAMATVTSKGQGHTKVKVKGKAFLHISVNDLKNLYIVFLFFVFAFYGPSRLFHTFWAESIVRWNNDFCALVIVSFYHGTEIGQEKIVFLP